MPFRYRRRNAARRIQRKWRGRRRKRARIGRAIVRKTGITGKAGIHMVKQKVYSTFEIPASSTNPLPFWKNITFQLTDIPQATSFRALYDQFCIFAVSTKIILNSNTSSTTNQNLQLGYVLNDRDGANTPVDWPQFMERAAVKIKNLYPSGNNACQATMYTKPRPLTQLYESPTSTGYKVNNKKCWIDMSDANVPHYGLLYGFNNGQEVLNAPINCTTITTYYIGFKGLI